MVALRRPKSPHGHKSRILSRSPATAKTRHKAIASNASDAAESEREYRALADRLAEVEKTSIELVSTLSHDLRNPLSVILVSARLLARSVGEGHAGHRHIDAVMRAADEINQTLQDVSDASNIEHGRLALACEPEKIAPLAERALAAVDLAASSKGAAIEKRFDADLPTVLVEPERFVKVLQHLLLNAIKYTPRGGTVTFGLERENDGVRVSVADNGPGITDEARVFAFSRTGAGKKPLAQGVGLGLFVTKGIVEAHGGEVWMESRVGSGSRFGFHLPAAPKDG
jgi:signal transduction histidine kinase